MEKARALMTDWTRYDGRTEWWFNTKTGEVEEGPQSLASERLGPFETREDAARALDIIAERSRKWAEEEAAEDD